MVAPLLPTQVSLALARGTPEELDEFNRPVEQLHIDAMGIESDFSDESRRRLGELRDKLFSTPQSPARPNSVLAK